MIHFDHQTAIPLLLPIYVVSHAKLLINTWNAFSKKTKEAYKTAPAGFCPRMKKLTDQNKLLEIIFVLQKIDSWFKQNPFLLRVVTAQNQTAYNIVNTEFPFQFDKSVYAGSAWNIRSHKHILLNIHYGHDR